MSAADKIAEAKGPERIWAHGNCMGRLGRPLVPGVSSHWATWETRAGDPNHATEYVRADLADAQGQEIARLREALDPNMTKADYIGEFKQRVYFGTDEEGNEIWEYVTISWDVIKQIMAAIRARAALGEAP